MTCLRHEKEKQKENNIIKDVRNLFRLSKENKAVKDRVIIDIRNLFEREEDYYKPVIVGDFWSNIYIEYEINGNKRKLYQLKNILIKLDHI